MKVEITQSKHINSWYYNKIGEVFEVIPYEKDDAYWELTEKPEPHITRLIKKDECKVVHEN